MNRVLTGLFVFVTTSLLTLTLLAVARPVFGMLRFDQWASCKHWYCTPMLLTVLSRPRPESFRVKSDQEETLNPRC